MNPYEREYFISRLRTGFYILSDGPTKIKLLAATIEQEYEVNEVYIDAYNSCVMDGILTEDEMQEWMIEEDLWSDEKEKQMEVAEKDIENLKVEVFQNRNKQTARDNSRKYLRRAEHALKNLRSEKEEFFLNTCEGIASTEKALKLFEMCCFLDGEPYDFPNDNISTLYYSWLSTILREKQVRELARTDPWRSYWALKDSANLFANKNTELTIDQKNILIWSQMYDNIQESMNCPSESVIDDDDMLDGWMILQKRKNASDKAQAELESGLNSKVANSDEIFIVTDNAKDAETINSMNSVGSEQIKKERMAVIKRQGEAKDTDFRDQKIRISNMQNAQFKGNFGRG